MAIARKLLFVAALVLLGASPAVLGGVGGPGVTFPWGQFGLPSCISGYVLYNNNGQVGCEEAPSSGVGIGVINNLIAKGQVAPQVFSTKGTATYATGTYTASFGSPAPTALAANTAFFVVFPSTNLGAADLIIGTLGTKPIKIINSAGTALTLVGGEIVPGPALLFYVGTEYMYFSPAVSSSIQVAAATAPSTSNFAYRDTFYLLSGGETITLPCSTALSPNDQIFVYSTSGTATIAVAASPCADNIIKNGNTSTTSQTVAQGAAAATVATDGAGNFYVSGS